MWYEISRIIFWLSITSVVIMKIRKTKIFKKKFAILLTVIAVLCLSFIAEIFPVENFFINFKSPEDVFRYAGFGKLDQVICGKNSCLVVYSKGKDSGGHYIVPKSENGYKIPGYFATKQISQKLDQHGSFTVYNVVGTTDYYIFGSVYPEDSEVEIFNGDDEKLEVNIKKIGDTGFTYFFLDSFTKEHYAIVNGVKRIIVK